MMRMKRLAFLFFLCLTLVSCGTRSGHFKVEGRFMHLNQGEIYVYSPDGAIQGFDTIKVETGRFAYEIPCEQPGELVLVFPNFSEHPIFAEPGATATVKADASHLKEMQVTGTDDNKLMTQFREQIAQVAPPEETRLATQFIKDHPDSRVAVYLLRKYFLRTAGANAAEGLRLADLLLKQQPKNGTLVTMRQQLQQRGKAAVGSMLPTLTATDLGGQKIDNAALRSADMGVVLVWATWSFPSQDMMRALQRAVEKKPELRMLAVSVDGAAADCRRWTESNHIAFPVVCDGQMLDSPLLAQIGAGSVPTALIVKKGKVVERVNDRQTLDRVLDPYIK